jgi:hypothetical protein
MATERQIAANRRNAVKSTGPRSSAGKRRARRNSYRHGLSVGAVGPGCAEHVERLARKIAGAGADAMVLEQARSVAQAQLDLTQIRRTRASLIQRMAEFGVLDTPDALGTSRDFKRILKSIVRWVPCDLPIPPAPSMPSSEPDRTAEAMKRALPELLKLDRYERSATARRDRVAGLIIARRTR